MADASLSRACGYRRRTGHHETSALADRPCPASPADVASGSLYDPGAPLRPAREPRRGGGPRHRPDEAIADALPSQRAARASPSSDRVRGRPRSSGARASSGATATPSTSACRSRSSARSNCPRRPPSLRCAPAPERRASQRTAVGDRARDAAEEAAMQAARPRGSPHERRAAARRTRRSCPLNSGEQQSQAITKRATPAADTSPP
jgi:hypothetical protein